MHRPFLPSNIWEMALVAITCVWGWTFVVIHDALGQLPASAFVAYRFLLASAAMAVLLRQDVFRVTKIELLGGVFAGVALFAAYAFQTTGLKFTTPSNTAFITGLSVVFTPLLMFVFLRNRLRLMQIAGVCLATIGLGLLSVRELAVHGGDLLVLFCAVSFGFHILILSKFSKTGDVGRLTLIQLISVGFLGTCWAAFSNELVWPTGPQIWWALILTAAVASTLAFFVQAKAQVTASPNKIALILTLEPVFGGLFGYFLSGDRFTATNAIGALLILLAVIVSEVNWAKSPVTRMVSNEER